MDRVVPTTRYSSGRKRSWSARFEATNPVVPVILERRGLVESLSVGGRGRTKQDRGTRSEGGCV